MSFIISSFIPFPNIKWWATILQKDTLCLDEAEHFEKMSYRNRYYISGANGLLQLSVPLINGRNQRIAIKDVQICNKDKWQVQHWRTLVSAYKRSPYFDHYEHSLMQLFQKKYDYLIDFNLDSMHWLKNQIAATFNEKHIDEYIKMYEPSVDDLRKLKPTLEKNSNTTFPQYYQVFADRNGFLPNLSLMDLLFSEGTYTMHWLKMQKEGINTTE